MARFYSNENFPLPVVKELRRLGHDVLTSLDAGNANQRIADAEVLQFASQEGRILLTLNRKHFVPLAEWPQKGARGTKGRESCPLFATFVPFCGQFLSFARASHDSSSAL
ncbi:MAG: DUF5615 family PIN-like protein [Verrucomicrobia bacterium]|nr:DUF5615 family PIN-like protein [Verrucomicrobiota bacterium]